MQHGTRTWIVTWLPVSCQTPSAERPPTPPTTTPVLVDWAPKWLVHLAVVTSSQHLVTTNTGSLMCLARRRKPKLRFFCQNVPKLTDDGNFGNRNNIMHDCNHTLFGVVCHPCARNCYGQPTYQIFSPYLHWLQRDKGNAKCRQWGGLEYIRALSH